MKKEMKNMASCVPEGGRKEGGRQGEQRKSRGMREGRRERGKGRGKKTYRWTCVG